MNLSKLINLNSGSDSRTENEPANPKTIKILIRCNGDFA